MTDVLTEALQRALGLAYRVERELGGGGMSRVFVARDLSLDREVVVKVLAPELSAGVSAERFTREIATAARLQQANIVPVLSAGTSNGLSYYTMPFVKGESLRSQLNHGVSLSLTDRVSVLRDVARALSYAHAEGFIHRDIKPDNILLSSGTAVVTDFGIAKAITAARTTSGASNATDGALTQLGSGIGTPAYIAPEQAVGEDIDARADIYAWGVVAYELLSGVHPFRDKVGAAQLIAAHIAETPKPLHEVNAAIPRDLGDLVMQTLSKQPSARPATAELLLSRLSSFSTLSGERPVATNVATKSRRWWKIAAVVMLVVVIPIALLKWGSEQARASSVRSIVVVPFSNLGDSANAYFAEGVSEEIGTQLARIPGVQVIGRTGVRKYLGSTKTPQEIAKELHASYVLSGSVQWSRGSGSDEVRGDARVRIVPVLHNVSTGQQEWDDAFNETLNDVFAVQAKVAERVASVLSIKLRPAEQAVLRRPESQDVFARNAQLKGRRYLRQRGLKSLRLAAAEFKLAYERDSTYARAWAGYSEAIGLLPSYFDPSISAERSFAEAKRAAQKAVALDSLLPEAHVALARALWYNFELKGALAAIDVAVRLDPSSALAHQQRYETLMGMGRLQEADSAIRRAIRLDETVPLLQFEIAILYAARSQMDSTLFAIDQAIALDPDNSAYWHGMRWAALLQLGRHEDAVKSCVTFGVAESVCNALSFHMPPRPGERERAVAVLTTMLGDTLGNPAPIPITVQAGAFSALGMNDRAFERLSVALRTRDPNLLSMQYLPTFKPIHNDPRWTALLNDFRNR